MQKNDRNLAWAALTIFAVIALEFAWFLFVGPTQGPPTCGIPTTPNCDLPWWDSAAFWTALFTLALTGSTVLLWWTTRQTLQHAEKQFFETELPYVVIENVQPTSGQIGGADEPFVGGGQPYQTLEVSYDIVNYGKNPAIVTKHYMAIHVGDALPAAPTPNGNDIFTNEFVMGANQRRSGFGNAFYRGRITREMAISLFYGNPIEGSAERLRAYAFGMVQYRSIGGTCKTMGGIWEYVARIHRFVAAENSAYNYHRSGD